MLATLNVPTDTHTLRNLTNVLSRTAVNRTLAYVELADGRDFAVTAVAAGMARPYVYGGKPVSRYPEIMAAEEQARAASRGLWGPPCNGNTQSTPL